MRPDEARQAFSDFDSWVAQNARQAECTGADVAGAIGLLRRLDLALRAPDALHLAITRRTESRVLTFDRIMAGAARKLGIRTAAG